MNGLPRSSGGRYWSRDRRGLLLAAGVAAGSLEICASCFSPARRPQDVRLSPCRCCNVLFRSDDVRLGTADGVGEARGSRNWGGAQEPVSWYSWFVSSCMSHPCCITGGR